MPAFLYLLIILFIPVDSIAKGMRINPDFINASSGVSEEYLNKFINSERYVLPGVYNVALYVNENYYRLIDIDVKLDKYGEPIFCKDMSALNIKEAYIDKDNTYDCGALDETFGAKAEFDKEHERFDYSIPNQYLYQKDDRETLERRVQENIINGVSVNYDFEKTISLSDNNTDRLYGSSQIYANVSQVRFYSSLNYENDELNYNNAYFKKSIYSLNSDLAWGDYNTNTIGSVTSGVNIRGVGISSVRSLFNPRGFQSHIPISGYVSSPSELKIYQDDRLVRTEYVQAGNYDLDSLMGGTSLTGKIKVVEKSLSGGDEVSREYFLSGSNDLLNTGESFFTFNAGYIKNSSDSVGSQVIYAGYKYGLDVFSPFVSSTLMDGYSNFELGSSVISPWGDNITLSFAGVDSDVSDEVDYAFSISYARDLSDKVNFYFLNNTYLSDNFISASEYSNIIDQDKSTSNQSRRIASSIGLQWSLDYRYLDLVSINYDHSEENQLSVIKDEDYDNVSQTFRLSMFGSLPTSLYGLPITYSTDMTYETYDSVNLQRDDELGVYFSIRIPFSFGNKTLSVSSVGITSRYSNDSQKNINEIDMNGSFNNENGSINARASDDSTYSMSLQNRSFGRRTTLTSSLNNEYASVGGYGSVIYTDETGLVLSDGKINKPLLVKAQGLEGSKQLGAEVNSDGYFAINSGTQYREAEYTLSTRNVSNGIDIKNPKHIITPGADGTFSLISYDIEKVNKFYARIVTSEGFLPLGTAVDVNDDTVYIDNDGGAIFDIKSPLVMDDISFKVSGKECQLPRLKENTSGNIIDLGVVRCEL
ncbi:outer membrane usher protein [Vibrio zhanjiangensis]|uniref:Outer membrane usher protein n=1 Tax=Vibrio zhanjiangensis TaxID=1046128 RepID=A0ABQ6F274_9VIBR|nr:fimbria/pilus outer membrane usher protein [Vibrio zhanjiangensis]GLT18822.1 outer membrane usher protein [Vibrio zhanjiangensis]